MRSGGELLRIALIPLHSLGKIPFYIARRNKKRLESYVMTLAVLHYIFIFPTQTTHLKKHFISLQSIIKRYINTNDRSVEHRPHRGKGGAEGRGGVFPSAKGRLYGFLNTKRDKNSLTHIKHWNVYRLVFMKTIQPAYG